MVDSPDSRADLGDEWDERYSRPGRALDIGCGAGGEPTHDDIVVARRLR